MGGGTYTGVSSVSSFTRTRAATACCSSPFSLSLFLSVSPNFDHTFTVTIHAIDSLTRLGEDELVDTVLAYFTLETVGMVRVVTSHNGLVENGQLADIAVV